MNTCMSLYKAIYRPKPKQIQQIQTTPAKKRKMLHSRLSKRLKVVPQESPIELWNQFFWFSKTRM